MILYSFAGKTSLVGGSAGIRDVWFMDNITITLVQPSSRSNLLVDNFNSEMLK